MLMKGCNKKSEIMETTKKKAVLFFMTLALSSASIFAQCREIRIDELTRVLKGLIEPTIGITLDKDNSRFSILGQTRRFAIPSEKISKVAHDWTYWVQDIRSDDSNMWFDKNRNHFVLDVRFEGNQSEIKGFCTGCRLGNKDNRAPDINWRGARIARLRLRPSVFEGSITIEVLDVELFGNFDLNGFLESIFPRMVRKIENRIKRDIQTKAHEILFRTDTKRQIARAIRGSLEALGIRNVRRIEHTPGSNLVRFCM